MMRRTATILAAVVVAVTALAGCTGGGDDGGAASPAPAGEPVVDDAGPEASGPSGRLQLTGFREDHPVGASVMLRAVEIDAAGNVLLDFEAVSVRSNVQIGRYSNLLEDDLGNRYQLVRVEDNPELALGEAERMTGTLAFQGPIDADSTRFTFAMNQVTDDERVSAGEQRPVQFPAFLFPDVPFPGVGLETAAINTAAGLLDAGIVEVGEQFTSEDNPDVELTVVSVANDGRSILVEIEVVNASGSRVGIVNDAPRLTDDAGRTFQFLRDESEGEDLRKLELDPGDEATATLAFLGTPGPDASELHLVLNALGIDRGELGRPGFRMTLPLPGLDGAGPP